MWAFDNKTAIYVQICDKIIQRILQGEYALGQDFPSVRDLAKEASVNPNTMQRALCELEERQILVSQKTLGRKVTEDEALIESVRTDYLIKLTREFAQKSAKIGLSTEKIISTVKEELENEHT